MTRELLNRRKLLLTVVAGGAALLEVQSAAKALAAPATQKAPDTQPSAGDEIDLSTVPDAVKQVADKAIPAAVWESAFKSKEDDKDLYELYGTDKQDRSIEVEVLGGKLLQVQRSIASKDVPDVVTTALHKKVSHFKITDVMELLVDGEVMAYEFEGKAAKDKDSTSILVAVDGSKVMTED